MKLTGVVKETKEFVVKPGVVARALKEQLQEAVRPVDIPHGAYVDDDERWVTCGWNGRWPVVLRPATADELADYRKFEQWADLTSLFLNRLFEKNKEAK
jgi:hypothetical protein